MQKKTEIPVHLKEIFDRRFEIHSEVVKLQGVWLRTKDAIEKGDPLYANINPDALEADINNAKRILRQSAPYAVCAYCGGDGENCRACDGKGWVTIIGWAATPKEMKEK